MDNEKSGKSRRKEKESAAGTSKRSVQEILEQARGDSMSEPVNKRSRSEEVTNLDEEDKVCVINLGGQDITLYLYMYNCNS